MQIQQQKLNVLKLYQKLVYLHLPVLSIVVQVYCGERFAVGNTNVPAAVRISIVAPKDLEELKKGLNILKFLLKHDDTFTML